MKSAKRLKNLQELEKLETLQWVERELLKKISKEYVCGGFIRDDRSGMINPDLRKRVVVIYTKSRKADLPPDFRALVPDDFLILQDGHPSNHDSHSPPSTTKPLPKWHPSRLGREAAAREYRNAQRRLHYMQLKLP